MPLVTTTIGAYPKPEYVRLPDWFTHPEGPDAAVPTQGWATAMAALGGDAEAIIARGVGEAIDDQIGAGIDIPTDGEIARENYIHYHCRHLDGVSFERLEEKVLRNGAYRACLPAIVGPVRAGAPFLPTDYRRAQSCTDRAVKITMPGPMTIADTTVDLHYDDPRALGRDLAAALNREVLALADAGCRHIQIDEPLFARKPGAALDYGFEHLERAFHGCPEHVTRTVHMCCGYPDRLDRPDYPKADPGSYFQLADAIEGRGHRRGQHRGRPSTERSVVARSLSPHHRDPRRGHDRQKPDRERRRDRRTARHGPGPHRRASTRRGPRLRARIAGAATSRGASSQTCAVPPDRWEEIGPARTC